MSSVKLALEVLNVHVNKNKKNLLFLGFFFQAVKN